MNLAFAIVFLWLGAACMTVAFHPLSLESGESWGAGAVVRSLQAKIAAQSSSASGA